MPAAPNPASFTACLGRCLHKAPIAMPHMAAGHMIKVKPVSKRIPRVRSIQFQTTCSASNSHSKLNAATHEAKQSCPVALQLEKRSKRKKPMAVAIGFCVGENLTIPPDQFEGGAAGAGA